VNVIAPLVTSDTGVLRQSTYFPYAWALRYARGRVLDMRVESETYPIRAAGLQTDFARNDDVPFVDLVATHDAANGRACLLMLNRDLEGEREVALDWRDLTPARVLACETLTGPDLKAFNTFEQPRRVAPQRLDAPAAGARMTFKLPPRSYPGGAPRRHVLEAASVSGMRTKGGTKRPRTPGSTTPAAAPLAETRPARYRMITGTPNEKLFQHSRGIKWPIAADVAGYHQEHVLP
jgi:hypothetical protein